MLFEFCDTSDVLFGIIAFSSREPVLVALSFLGDGADVKTLMKLSANVTFFGWHQFLFAMLLLAVLESDFEGGQSWLSLSVCLGNTVVAPCATSIVLTCWLRLSRSCRGP